MQRSLTKLPHHQQHFAVRPAADAGQSAAAEYNIADTWVVSRFLGADALAAVENDP